MYTIKIITQHTKNIYKLVMENKPTTLDEGNVAYVVQIKCDYVKYDRIYFTLLNTILFPFF